MFCMLFLDFSTVEKRSRDETRRDGDGDGDAMRRDATRCESNYMSTFSLKHYQRYLTDAFG